jgi:hypothetical protein
LAGPDIANGWGGFIDGAIESGMEAAVDAASLLAAHAHCADGQELIAGGQRAPAARCQAGFHSTSPSTHDH